MKKIQAALAILMAAFALPSAAGELSLVEENHALLEKNGVTYILDSYIVPFEVPFYILVRRQDSQVISVNEVEPVVIEYIKPRGCTAPPKRRADLDRKSSDSTALVLGVAC